jgi:hypothetical protein
MVQVATNLQKDMETLLIYCFLFKAQVLNHFFASKRIR